MALPIAYKYVDKDDKLVERYADTKEEAFNLLFSGMLVYQGNIVGERTVEKMLREYPPTLMSEEEYKDYGKWVIEGEVTNTLLSIKRKFSLSLEDVKAAIGVTTEEVIARIDQAFIDYEEKYIRGIQSVLEIVIMGVRMKMYGLIHNE